VFYNPQPSAAQAAALYSRDYFETDFPASGTEGQVQLAQRRLDRIEREVPVGSLLDVGCGPGRFLGAARQRGWEAAGLDVSPAAAAMARSASGVRVFEGELTGPRPPELEPVDVLTMWDVLEHLTDPVAALAEALGWLKPNGLLIVQTENVNSITASWMGSRWEQFVQFHLYHFSPSTLRSALERSGFERVARFAPPDACDGMPTGSETGASAARRWLRRLRDRLYILAGRDAFNVMVATARRRAEMS
jgi:SAM-dependent methyltransferase